MLGTLKWYNRVRGYGFIAVPVGADVFFHYTNLVMDKKVVRELCNMPGAPIQFTLSSSERGPKAEEIKLAPMGEVRQ